VPDRPQRLSAADVEEENPWGGGGGDDEEYDEDDNWGSLGLQSGGGGRSGGQGRAKVYAKVTKGKNVAASGKKKGVGQW